MTDASSQEFSESSSANQELPRPVPGSVQAPADHRPLWTAVIVLFALVVGTLAGLLAFAGDAKLPAAALTAGTAFAGTVLLLLAVAHYLGRS